MRVAVALAFLAFTAVHAAGQDAPPELSIPHTEGIVETLDLSFPPAPEEAASERTGPAQWTQSILRAGAHGIQVHLSGISYEPGEFFEIEIVDGNGSVVQTLDAETVGDRQELWSDIGQGQSLGISVFGNRGGSLRFVIDAVSFDRMGPVLESIVGTDDREHLYRYAGDLLATVGRVRGAVAKLSFIAGSGDRAARYVCTGFLIADDTLVTNEHCVADAETCATTKVIFGYAYDNLGRMPGMEQYDCRSVETVNSEFDIAVLKLAGEPGLKWGLLALAANDVRDDERLFVLQHPAGEPKQISDIDCSVFRARAPGRGPDSDFAHSCDTLGGSSGSPVFNVLGEVVGLHHWGRAPSGEFANANRAVRAGNIRDLLVPADDNDANAAVASPEGGENDQPIE